MAIQLNEPKKDQGFQHFAKAASNVIENLVLLWTAYFACMIMNKSLAISVSDTKLYYGNRYTDQNERLIHILVGPIKTR